MKGYAKSRTRPRNALEEAWGVTIWDPEQGAYVDSSGYTAAELDRMYKEHLAAKAANEASNA